MKKKLFHIAIALVSSLGLITAVAPAHAAPAPPVYYGLGDSYPAGVGNEFNGGASYVDLLVAGGYAAYGGKLAVPEGGTISAVIEHQIPQIERKAKLVTVTVGGNDVGWLEVVQACISADPRIPGSVDACLWAQQESARAIAGLGAPLDAMIAAIKAQTPSARILVVGYPQVFATEGAYASLGLLNMQLNAALAEAAFRADVRFVDVAVPGHDVMQPIDRWINNPLFGDQGTPLHPNAAGQQAIFDAVLTALPGNFHQAAKGKPAA